MIKSMTGYGRGTTKRGGDKINVEIKSLNSRYLDIRFLGININPKIEQKINNEDTYFLHISFRFRRII